MATVTKWEKHRTRSKGKTTVFYTVITNMTEGINNPRGNHFYTKEEAESFIRDKINKGYIFQ